MLGALKHRDASLASGHVAPPFPGAPDTSTRVPHAGLPGRGAKQQLLSGSHRPSHLAALLRSDPCSPQVPGSLLWEVQPWWEVQLLSLQSLGEKHSQPVPSQARLVQPRQCLQPLFSSQICSWELIRSPGI